jgi:hypothetical protein
MLTIRSRGFWRLASINKLSKKINKGNHKLKYLRDLITLHKIENDSYSFIKFTSIKSLKDKWKSEPHKNSQFTQTIFVTQVSSDNKRRTNNFYKKLFLNEDEEKMYNPISLRPFETKYVRYRDQNQKYFNVQEIKKEIEKNYDNIREELIKDRPYSQYYKSHLKNNLLGIKSRSLSSTQQKKGKLNKIKNNKYNINININNNNKVQNREMIQDKRRLASAYLNTKPRGYYFNSKNKLFKGNKNSRTIISAKNKPQRIINISNPDDYPNNNMYSNDSLLKKQNFIEKFPILNIKSKVGLNNGLYNTLNDENKNKNFFNENLFKKLGKMETNPILNNRKNIYKNNFFVDMNQYYKNQKVNLNKFKIGKSEDNKNIKK